MCLDTVASGNSLYMHVSKAPKEGSTIAEFFKVSFYFNFNIGMTFAVKFIYSFITCFIIGQVPRYFSHDRCEYIKK